MGTASSTSRIAKNTLLLYFRQILIMLVSLYTVRVVLKILGEEDYGIYNVVAGVVVLFSFVNAAMTDSTQRFLNYALGKKDNDKVNQIFSASLVIHTAIAGIFLLAAETIGLWFVNNKLNIPAERHSAAMIVYQLSIAASLFGILRVPYNAVIIAYEKMSFFAGISILEAVFKLAIVYCLTITTFDELITYAFLTTIISVVFLLVYKLYCNKKFETANYKNVKNKQLTKDLISFSSWSLFGATANVCNQQGTNVVMNIFTNVTANAAMGIANQVNTAVFSFVSNFQLAFKPQLIKLYAADQKKDFMNLILRTSKFSFFLLFIIVLPLYLNTDFVLNIWLENPPEYSIQFVRLILICSLIEAINGPLWMSIQATGKIKNYQLIVSALIFMNLPMCIVAFKLGASPLCVLTIRLIMLFITTIWRIFYLSGKIQLPVAGFFRQVLLRCSVIGLTAYFGCVVICKTFVLNEIPAFFVSCALAVSVSVLLIYFIGVNKSEKDYIIGLVKSKFSK